MDTVLGGKCNKRETSTEQLLQITYILPLVL